MKWREIVKAFANAARHREHNAKSPPPNGPGDREHRAFGEGAAYAYHVMAEEMDHIAKLAPHEALDHVRKLAALKQTEGAS